MTAGTTPPRPGSEENEDPVQGPFQVSSCMHRTTGDRPVGADVLPPKIGPRSPLLGTLPARGPVLTESAPLLGLPAITDPTVVTNPTLHQPAIFDPQSIESLSSETIPTEPRPTDRQPRKTLSLREPLLAAIAKGPEPIDEEESFHEEAMLLLRDAAQQEPTVEFREAPARGGHSITVPRSHALFTPPANRSEPLYEIRYRNSVSDAPPGAPDNNSPSPTADRQYGCSNYETCLNIAAALNWETFTCGRCSGSINQQLVWQAHQARRRDGVARALCSGVPGLGGAGQRGLLPKK